MVANTKFYYGTHFMEINFGKAVNNTKNFQRRKKTTDTVCCDIDRYSRALLSFFTPSVYSCTEFKFWYHAVGSIRAKFCAICSLLCEMNFRTLSKCENCTLTTSEQDSHFVSKETNVLIPWFM